MSADSRCPECQTPLPPDSSVCPRCLLELGLGGDGVASEEAETVGQDPGSAGPEDPTLAYTATISESPGDRVGPYHLIELLGEGGMGMVYLAEQEEPIRRRVALKIIKLGMDSREIIARFEAERQALAMMDHPNIAKVFDAGTTSAGRPYFVMELVEGVHITDYCDRHRLDAHQRLELLIRVCEGLHHAHQKGLIHRDIKPSNILVSEVDGRPVPKIIDFGVAKATRQQLTEKTLFTQQGLMVGTPEYMSPEQAGLADYDVDTTTDIYSVGVLLYELLTGSLPFIEHLRAAGFAEMQRIIREEDPAKPSTRVSTMGEVATEVAEDRHTDPSTLRRSLQGDLDWITLKALEKDRTRRYQAATEFAQDLENYLSHRPVLASPPSLTYKAGKFVRRHRGPVAAGVAFVLLLIAATITSMVLYARAEEERAARNRELVDLMVTKGMQLADESDNLSALPWLTKALELEEADETPHRLRIQSVLDHAPGLHRMWNHGGAINHAEFSPDGQLVVSAGEDGTARLWSVGTGEPVGEPLAHDGAVLVTDFGPDGGVVATAGEDGTARLWSTLDGRAMSPPLQHPREVVHLAFQPESGRLVTAAADGWVRAWDHDSWTAQWQLEYGENLERVRFDKQGAQLVALGGPRVLLVDPETGEIRAKLSRNEYFIRRAAFSHDGTKLVTGSGDQIVTVWDLETEPTILHSLQISELKCLGCALGLAVSDDDRVAVGGWDRKVRIWDVSTGEEFKHPYGREIETTGGVSDLRFAANDSWILAVAFDGSIRVWQYMGPLTPTLHLGDQRSAEISPDASLLLTAGADGLIRLWDLAGATPPATILRHSQYVWNAEFDASGERVATGSGGFSRYGEKGQAQLWDVESGNTDAAPFIHSDATWVRVSEEGGRMVTYGWDGTAQLWDLHTGEALAEPIVHPAAVIQAEFSRDGRQLAIQWRPPSLEDSNAGSGGVIVYDALTGSVLNPAVGEAGEQLWGFLPGAALVTSWKGEIRIWGEPPWKQLRQSWRANKSDLSLLQVSPDGAMLASSGDGGTTAIWDRETGSPVGPTLVQSHAVTWLEFDPEGRLLATANAGGEASVWDVGTGSRLQTVRHERTIYDAAFSHDSRWLLTVSDDGSARVWSVETGEPVTVSLRHLAGPGMLLQDGEFAPDGTRFITTGFDAQIWYLSPTDRSVAELLQVGELLSGQKTIGPHLQRLGPDEVSGMWERAPFELLREMRPRPDQVLSWIRATNTLGGVTQKVDAKDYRGKNVRVQASLRIGDGAQAQAQIWLRVDRGNGARGYFDNMSDRPIKTTSWQGYVLEGPVAEDAESINFGVMFSGRGFASVDDFRVESVDGGVTEPVLGVSNLGFEDTSEEPKPAGWRTWGSTAHQFGLSDQSPLEGQYSLEWRSELPPRLEAALDDDDQAKAINHASEVLKE